MMARECFDDGIGYLINEKGQKIIEDKIDISATRVQVLHSLKKSCLGKFFILYNENSEIIFVDSKGYRLELPIKLSHGDCLGNGVYMEANLHYRTRFKKAN